MAIKCEFCKKNFANKYILKKHQSSAKFCLKIQDQIKKDTETNICEYCNRTYKFKYNLTKHLKFCKIKKIEKEKEENILENRLKDCEKKLEEQTNKYNQELKEKDREHKKEMKEQEAKYMKQICDLQDRIQELATKAIEKPTTTKNNYTTNTNIMNLAPLDMEEFAKRVEEVIMNNMNENHLIEGQAGVARLLSGSGCLKTNEGKNFITCTDISRGVWKHKDKDGNVVKDYKAGKIAKVVHPIANKKADGIVSDFTMTGNSQRRLEELERMISENKEKLEAEEDFLEGFNQEDPEYDNTLRKMCKLEDDIRYWTSEMKRINSEDSVHRYNYNEVLFKLYKGKKELVGLNDDSTNFSNKLISLV